MYATVADLIARVGETEIIRLTDRADPPSGAIGVAVAEDALTAATAEVDGYLSTRMTVPLSPTPRLIRDLTVTLAWARLWTIDRPETLQKDREAALATLRALADGSVSLGIPNPPPTTTGGPLAASSTRVFYDRSMRGQGGWLR